MSALGRFGRFTLFSPRVSHSNTCRLLSFVCFVLLFGFVALVCFCFLFCECLGIPNSPRSLDLDDRQGLIARSAMQQKKKDGACPPGIDLDRATLGFNIDNTAAFQAIEDSKALHARRWQTKEGTYRIKRRALPDVRDEPLQDVNAAASCSDDRPRWRCWDGDFAMGVQHHT